MAGRPPDILRKSHAHRHAKDYDRRTGQQDIEEGLNDMIQTAYSVKGWTATNTETGETATATFLEGESVAVERVTPQKKAKGFSFKAQENEAPEASQ
jgi:hypothetical protein